MSRHHESETFLPKIWELFLQSKLTRSLQVPADLCWFHYEAHLRVRVRVIDNTNPNPNMGFTVESTHIDRHLSRGAVRLHWRKSSQNYGGKASESSTMPSPKGA